jgi:hypothetical protein
LDSSNTISGFEPLASTGHALLEVLIENPENIKVRVVDHVERHHQWESPTLPYAIVHR